MYKKIFQTILLCAFLGILSVSINAQKKNLVLKTLSVSKKATVIVVGNTAKFTYKVTKFTATKVAKPIIVKSAPKVGKFMLKKSGFVIKKTFPVAKKLFVKYVKHKFIP